jgi:hypothetical protein
MTEEFTILKWEEYYSRKPGDCNDSPVVAHCTLSAKPGSDTYIIYEYVTKEQWESRSGLIWED